MIASTHDVLAELDIGSLLEQLGANVVHSKPLPVHPDSPHVQNLDRSLWEDSKLPRFLPVDPDWKQKNETKKIASYNSRVHGACVQICESIESHEPKIDAIILHNMNINQESARFAAIDLTRRIKARCPVIVCDYCDSKVAIQAIENAGANYFDFDTLNFEPLAAAVADIIARRGKPQRNLGL